MSVLVVLDGGHLAGPDQVREHQEGIAVRQWNRPELAVFARRRGFCDSLALKACQSALPR